MMEYLNLLQGWMGVCHLTYKSGEVEHCHQFNILISNIVQFIIILLSKIAPISQGFLLSHEA